MTTPAAKRSRSTFPFRPGPNTSTSDRATAATLPGRDAVAAAGTSETGAGMAVAAPTRAVAAATARRESKSTARSPTSPGRRGCFHRRRSGCTTGQCAAGRSSRRRMRLRTAVEERKRRRRRSHSPRASRRARKATPPSGRGWGSYDRWRYCLICARTKGREGDPSRWCRRRLPWTRDARGVKRAGERCASEVLLLPE